VLSPVRVGAADFLRGLLDQRRGERHVAARLGLLEEPLQVAQPVDLRGDGHLRRLLEELLPGGVEERLQLRRDLAALALRRIVGLHLHAGDVDAELLTHEVGHLLRGVIAGQRLHDEHLHRIV